jgi:hypothetical protein
MINVNNTLVAIELRKDRNILTGKDRKGLLISTILSAALDHMGLLLCSK